MDELTKKAVEIRIKKYEEKFTSTEKYIAKIILENPEVLENKTLDAIAREASSSQASIYRFVQKIGFNNIFALKHWLVEKSTEHMKDSPLVVDVIKTLAKFDNIETQSITDLILSAKKIFITAKASSVHIARSLEWKLVKLNFNVTFVSVVDWDLYYRYPNAVWIFVSISGTSFKEKNPDLIKLTKNSQLVLFSAIAPSLEIASNFNYTFYGQTIQEFLAKEIYLPLDSELLCLLVINEFIKIITSKLSE